jgi:D-sedoheptulose 7-phosphate isomerase
MARAHPRPGVAARVMPAGLTFVDDLLARRSEASELFFGAEAGRIAHLCRELAGRFQRGGRLIAVASSAQGWSDAHHVAVEFVHPVIVGKRALPAIALSAADAELLAGPDDIVMAFDAVELPGDPLKIAFAPIGADRELAPPADDPFVRQELVETLYHVVWELVHVFFEHGATSSAGAGSSAFLYPFLERGNADLDGVEEDVRRSVLAKAEEALRLREQTLTDAAGELCAAAEALRELFDRGGKLLAFGNGGSATDAMDLVADLRASPQGWPARPALDLTADAAILTALANDIGTDALFARQIIAYGREGDAVVALSTSGNSANVIEALAEARRRDLLTIAFVGYDGGRVASEGLADHVIVTRSEHIPRIQEAQATAYHALRELLDS